MGLFNWLFESEEERVKRLILKRQNEAIKKGIAAKVAFVAELLGVSREFKSDPDDAPDGRCKTMYIYSDPVIEGLSYFQIVSETKLDEFWTINLKDPNSGVVFKETKCGYYHKVSAYAPGPWEAHLESLCKRALTVQAEKNKKAAEGARKEEQNKRKRFGL